MADVSADGPGDASGAIRVTFAPASSYLDLPPLLVRPTDAHIERPDAMHAVLVQDGGAARKSIIMEVIGDGSSLNGGRTRREVVVDGWRFELEAEVESRASLRERARRGAAAGATGGPLEVRAVIPGRVLAIAVATGEQVDTGRPLLIIEAMKMQNEVRAARAGVVARIQATPGQTVEVGDLLVVLE